MYKIDWKIKLFPIKTVFQKVFIWMRWVHSTKLAENLAPQVELFFRSWSGKAGKSKLDRKKLFFRWNRNPGHVEWIFSTLTRIFSKIHNFFPENQRLIKKQKNVSVSSQKEKFRLKTFIWTRKNQVWQTCHRVFTKLSIFFDNLRKQNKNI